MRPRIKICCISSVEEAAVAIRHGASALGLVGPMPSGPGVISDEMISEIAKTVPPPIGTFLLTSETLVDNIIAHHKRTFTNTIQLVDELSERQYGVLKEALPGIKIVQVIHVIDEDSVDEAIEVGQFVDALLLDSGNPKAAIKELGGTGRVHNWKLSRKIVEQVRIPVFLAGGLRLDNIKKALDEVGPFGFDLCTGVRTDGKLDPSKLEAFMKAVG